MTREFLEPAEELVRVAEEINLLRRDLKESFAMINRIERRLKAAYPNYPDKPVQSEKKKQQESDSTSKTRVDLLNIFEKLVACIQNGGEDVYFSMIKDLSDLDIIALAVEIGIGSKSKLSRRKSEEGIRKRVQEALQLQFSNKKSP